MEQSAMVKDLFSKIEGPPEMGYNKITIVGAGMVGLAAGICLLNRQITDEIYLIDTNADLLKGEMLDLQQGSTFINNAKINSGNDYKLSAGSRICIIAAGTRAKPEESPLTLLQQNSDVIKGIVPKLVKYSPKTILVMVTEPVDILTYVAWKISGLPVGRVIGTGTSLDTSRFRYLLSQRLKVGPSAIHAWVIGEHGESAVPIWSSVNVAGVRLRDIDPKIGTPNDPKKFHDIATEFPKLEQAVAKKKGYTCWAIGLCVAEICNNICTNSGEIMTVSTHAKGVQGIDKDVFLSLPCVLKGNGVRSIIKENLTNEEKESLKKSACVLCEAQSKLTV